MNPRPGSAPHARTPRRWLVNLVSSVALLGLLALVSSTAPRWSRLLRQPVPSTEDLAEPADDGPLSPSPQPTQVERQINVKLFFEAPDASGLVIEERTVAFSADLAQQIENVVAQMLLGSQAGLVAPLPAETRALGVFLSGRGVAYVNLSKEALGGLSGGSRSELLSVYALVDTLSANFPAVTRVQVLIEDRPAETLAGHVDLSRPLSPDMSLLAASTLTPATPQASPPPESTAAPAPQAAAPPTGPAPANGGAR